MGWSQPIFGSQVKQILGLRDELLLRSLVSAWQQRAQLRRLVLCGKAISEVRMARADQLGGEKPRNGQFGGGVIFFRAVNRFFKQTLS